jgi:hypothetical protein
MTIIDIRPAVDAPRGVTSNAAPFAGWAWHIVHDADLNDPLPQFQNKDGTPYNLTGKTVEIYIRPTYGHETLLRKLTSAAGAGVTVNDAVNGLCTAHLARSEIQTDIPVGEWNFFITVNNAGAFSEFARGPFIVHPGRTSFVATGGALSLDLSALDSQKFQDAVGTILASANNDPVGYWVDLSGNERHVIQATSGNRPLLQTALPSLPGFCRTPGRSDRIGNHRIQDRSDGLRHARLSGASVERLYRRCERMV